MQITSKKNNLFTYLMILTALFILLEISYFIQRSDIYLGDYKLVADRLGIPFSVVPGILYFLFVQLSLHFIFLFTVMFLTLSSASIFKLNTEQIEKYGIFLWFFGIATILLANECIYPNSKFAGLIAWVIYPKIANVLLIISLIILSIISMTACWGVIKGNSKKLKVLLLSVCIIPTTSLISSKQTVMTDAATAAKPNIILIGIDAVRPDFLGYFGATLQTPYLDSFLNQSAVFSDSLTAIARTFPSWVSILTGEYPKKSGVRFNLPMIEDANWHVDWKKTLPSILRQHGYQTIFATDEVRFSNIDEHFGFDRVVTPPVGFNDFLLGTLNDFPMANLLVNTRIGKYLFPHSFGNRPAFSTYDPDSFLKLVQPTLAVPREKPLFLAVHFCLPHFPYFWGKKSLHDKSIDNYRDAIQRVDQQFHDFLILLNDNKILNHAIIIVLSDHGEAIELRGDRVTDADLFVPGLDNKQGVVPHFYPQSFDDETINQSAGHGTDILSLTQYHNVLAMRMIGTTVIEKPLLISNKVSLLDIKPTLLEYLHIPVDTSEDGFSRLSLVLGQKKPVPEKDFFMETDYSPQAVRSVHPETRKLLFAGIDFFQIDSKTTRLTVKPSMGKLIISSKQYADIKGSWILALYPQDGGKMMPILVNLDDGQWTNDLHTDFAKKSPASQMLVKMKKFFGSDITQIVL